MVHILLVHAIKTPPLLITLVTHGIQPSLRSHLTPRGDDFKDAFGGEDAKGPYF